MDYGVFLLSCLKEEYDLTGDHEAAVRHGLQRTGGLITAAAVILAVVMDAMVVRRLLVPAIRRLTGRAAWWAPAPLRRFHERFGVSRGELPAPSKGRGVGRRTSTPAER
ncbi:hypothetical protein SRB17_03070 [Streptomyces sp. RB17]|nr:hypothetical protein [Streptomyces sp. RB17]